MEKCVFLDFLGLYDLDKLREERMKKIGIFL